MKKRYVYLFLTIAFTGFIFCRSLQPAEESAKESLPFVMYFVNLVRKLSDYPFKNLEELITVIVRKVAHISEYAVQACLMCGLFQTFPLGVERNLSWIMFIGLMTACIDEAIQLTAEGRAGLVSDIFVDFAGTLLGICIGLAIIWILFRKGKKA